MYFANSAWTVLGNYNIKIVTKKKETHLYDIRTIKLERLKKNQKLSDLLIDVDYKHLFLKLRKLDISLEGTHDDLKKNISKCQDNYDEMKRKFHGRFVNFVEYLGKFFAKIRGFYRSSEAKKVRFCSFYQLF